jgi:nicotinamidase-related amidase
VSNGPEITGQVARLLEAARQHGYRVIFLRHMSMPTKLMGAFQFRQAMAWQRVSDPAQVKPWFLRGSPGFAIVPELAPRDARNIAAS